MYRSLRSYFVESVLQDFKAFEANLNRKKIGISKDLRLAQSSAISQYHLAEYIYKEFSSDKLSEFRNYKDFENYLVENDFGFALTRDLANCHKHRTLTRGKPLIEKAEDILEVVVITQYRDEKGPYKVAKKFITAKLSDGRELDVYKILYSTIYLWYDLLFQLGVLKIRIEMPELLDEIPKRDNDSEAARLDLEALRAEDMQMKMIFVEHSYEKPTRARL